MAPGCNNSFVPNVDILQNKSVGPVVKAKWGGILGRMTDHEARSSSFEYGREEGEEKEKGWL